MHINFINKCIERSKDVLVKWKRAVITAAIHMKRLNMTAGEFFEGKYKTIKPYDNVGSYEFIQSVKYGETEEVMDILKENKFLVHNFDHVIDKRF